jgi:multidrug resistance efflux pump
MLYTWSSVYKSQVVEGDNNSELKQAISIWLLTGTFFKTDQAQNYWLYFFKEAKHWKSLPQLLQGLAVMRQATNTLVRFSEQQKEFHRYQSRLDQIRVLKSDEALMKEAMGEVKAVRAELETAKAETETVKAEVETAKSQNEQLMAQLRQAGIEPKIVQATTFDATIIQNRGVIHSPYSYWL